MKTLLGLLAAASPCTIPSTQPSSRKRTPTVSIERLTWAAILHCTIERILKLTLYLRNGLWNGSHAYVRIGLADSQTECLREHQLENVQLLARRILRYVHSLGYELQQFYIRSCFFKFAYMDPRSVRLKAGCRSGFFQFLAERRGRGLSSFIQPQSKSCTVSERSAHAL